MTFSDDAIKHSYDACHRVARRSGSNFYATFLRLPTEKRRAMEALYAFMRHTDDLVDAPQSVEVRRTSLQQWRDALAAALTTSADITPRDDRVADALLPAVADTVARFDIPPVHLEAVIDGVEQDLTKRRYQNFDELVWYCEHVASAVGLACICIWGFSGPEAIEPARQSGIAMQLTNILRDLKEDAQQDRVYLPAEDLLRYDYTADDLKQGITDERFDCLIAFQIERAERFYHEGEALQPMLSREGQRAFGLMMDTYHGLLQQIRRNPRDIMQRRISLGRPKKLRLLARWLLRSPEANVLAR